MLKLFQKFDVSVLYVYDVLDPFLKQHKTVMKYRFVCWTIARLKISLEPCMISNMAKPDLSTR